MRKINIKNQAKAKSIEIAQISDAALEGIVSGVVADLAAEEAARAAADASTLSSAQIYTDVAISALVDQAPTALDTLKELADALTNDQDALNALIVTVDNNSAARVAGDQALSGHIDSVSGLVDDAVASLQAEISSQAATLDADLVALEDALTTETAARVSGDSNLEGLLQSEASTREAADTFLSGAVTGVVADLAAETAAREASDTFLSGAVTGVVADLATEQAAREAADLFVSGAIDTVAADLTTEVSDREAAVGFVSGAIDSLSSDLTLEVADRLAADGELTDDLDFVSGAVTGVVADLGVEQTAREAADTFLSGAITGVVADLDVEEAARAAADTFLSGAVTGVVADLTLEVSDRLAGDSELAADLAFVSGAVTGVVADLGAEESARAAADTFLSGAITGVVADLATETSARVAGDASTLSSAQSYTDSAISDLVNGAPVALDTLKELADALASDESALNSLIVTVDNHKVELDADVAFVSGAVDTLSADLDAQVAALATDIGTEESARQAADTFISGAVTGVVADLAAEASARQAADTFLSGAITGVVADLDAEEAARAAADTALSGAIDALDADLGFVSGAVVTLDGTQTITGAKTLSGPTALSQGLNVKVDGDAYSRLMIENGGSIYLGSGSAGWDTHITRSGSEQLSIFGDLQVSKSVGIAQTLTVVGNTVLSGSATVAGTVNIGQGDYALWSAAGKVSAGLGFAIANNEYNNLTVQNGNFVIGAANSLKVATNNGPSAVDAMTVDASGNMALLGSMSATKVTLAADPTLALEAATKQYVDTADTALSGAVSGTAADLATLTSAFNSFKATIGNPVDAETVTFDANGEYVLSAAASGIVSGSKPILAINGVVQEYGTDAAADFQVVMHGGYMKKIKLNEGFVLEAGDTAVVWYRAAI